MHIYINFRKGSWRISVCHGDFWHFPKDWGSNSMTKIVLFCKNEGPFTRFPKPIENTSILTLIQYLPGIYFSFQCVFLSRLTCYGGHALCQCHDSQARSFSHYNLQIDNWFSVISWSCVNLGDNVILRPTLKHQTNEVVFHINTTYVNMLRDSESPSNPKLSFPAICYNI